MRIMKWAFLAGLLCSGLFTTGNLPAEQTDTAEADSGLFMTAEFPAERTDTVAKFSAVQTDTGQEPNEEDITTVEEDEAPAVEPVEYIEPGQPISEQASREQPGVDNSEPGVFSLASLEALAESDPAGVADEFISSEMVSFDGGGLNASSVGPCCSVCGGGSRCPPNWYTEHGVRNLGRGKPRHMQLTGEFLQARSDDDFTSTIVVPSWQLIRADDTTTAAEDSMWQWQDYRTILPRTNLRAMGFQNAPGYTVTLGRYLGRDSANRDQFIEFTYWGLNHWETSKDTNGILKPEYTTVPAEGFLETTVVGITNKGSSVTYPGETEPRKLTTPPISRYSGTLRSPFLLSTELTDERRPEFVQDPQLVETALALDMSFNNVLQHSMAYKSTANDFEINARLRPRGRADRLVLDPNGKWRRECQPGNFVSYLFGLRVMSIDEAFRFGSNGQIISFRYAEPQEVQDPNDPQADPTTEYEVLSQLEDNVGGDYAVRTHNDLFGFQVGADLIYRKCRWRYGVKAKAGPYVNFSDQFSHVTTDAAILRGNFPDANSAYEDQTFAAQDIRRRGRKNSVALLAEVGFVGEYRIRPNMNVRAAYDFMWITGLALAPEQMQFRPDPTNAVNTNGHIFSHGITLTAEWMW